MSEGEIKVLVIDDEKMVSNILRDFLEDEDFTVEIAQSGSEALEKIRANSYDAAVVDMTLNDMDGDKLIKKALAIDSCLLCLIHTGAVDYTISTELADLGISDEHIFFKPIHDMTDLSNRIRSLLKER
ncbi:MAG: two-component system response regulator [Spirochaetae bacterium HGW-Spirochaetae-1]|jgi:DNA-binding response OmpR family regulator|nr:MAG: two-component system response regulator [Spirochaetae bacterium HGW-Spirochaetae-1]